MNKKADVPWILVMFAIALVVLVVIIAILVSKAGVFKSGTEQATDKIYRCYCTPPGEKTVCKADGPVGYEAKTINPLTCTSGWEDCEEKCWKEVKNE